MQTQGSRIQSENQEQSKGGKMKQEEWIPIAEYCKREGISRQAVYKRIKAGKIESKRHYNARLIKVEYLAQQAF
jgi:hypothetical protein